MSAISQKLPNLIGGVSQQPDTLKFSNQFRSCTNYYPDLTFGLAKRPGIEGIAKLTGAVANGTWFTMFRDEREKYIIQFSKAGALRIWDAKTGTQQTVNAITNSATIYATHKTSDDLVLFQINDYAFVVNRKVIVEEKAGTQSASITPFGIAIINTVAYSTTYKIKLDANTFSYSTPTTAGTALNVTDITGSLVTAINGNANYVAQAIGNTIHVRRANDANFSLSAEGGQTGTAIEAFKGTVPLISKLPQQFFNNLKIKVEADPESKVDDYWVQFKTSDNGASGAGKWLECIAPNTIQRLNENTMPHAIIREANGSFTFRVLDKASADAATVTLTTNGIVADATVSPVTGAGETEGRYKINQRFYCFGGSGTGLRLRVTKTKTVTYTNNYSYPSSNYIKVTRGLPGQDVYTYYENNKIIGFGTEHPYTVGFNTYSKYGNATTTPAGTFYGMTITEKIPDCLDTLVVDLGGKNYVSGETVTNKYGDNFIIGATNSFTTFADNVIKNYWRYRTVGDEETNPVPTFVGRPIHGISFFRNRLVLTSGENVICSQTGDYFDFFLSTIITTVEDDVIDIACGSLRPVELRYALPSARGLLLFSSKSQYILTTTTEAFSGRSAEINTLSQYEQDDDVSPFDTGSSIVFVKQGENATNVYEMAVNGEKAEVVELTRTIPSYVPNAISYLNGSSSASTFALTTPQKSNDIYLFRYFNAESRVMSSWFKWTTPGIVESMSFDHDLVYLVTKQDNAYVLGHINLLTESPGGAVKFEDKFVDLRLDLFDYRPTRVYLAATDETKVCFKDGFENLSEQPVVVSLSPKDPGNALELPMQVDLTAPVGQRYFVLIDGDQTNKRFALGYKYTAEAELPAFYVIQDEGRKDTLNIPTIHRIHLNSYESGPFKVHVNADNRADFSLTLPQEVANLYPANTVPMIRNAQNTIPVMAKGTQVSVSLVADAPFPTAFTSLNWEGTYNNKGIRG